MAIFEIKPDSIVPIEETTFGDAGIKERSDLQRLLRDQIDVVSPETLVISEEYGEWEVSKRRIDLLGIDKHANLVVIELKRTEDGGHMELQAIRYAAMVSTLTFENVVEAYSAYLVKRGSKEDAKSSLLEFLGWSEPEEDEFVQDVQIVLVAANFSKELTSSIMWLNDRDIDIRAVKIQPYKDDERVLIDIQQLIPLPEASDYQVKIKEKVKKGRKERSERYSLRKHFWQKLLERAKEKTSLHANISPNEFSWVGTSSGVKGLSLNYVTGQHEGRVELYIDRSGDGQEVVKQIFDSLHAKKTIIEQAFGEELYWQRLDDKRASRISFTTKIGGYRDDEQKWPEIQDAMIELMMTFEKSLRPHLDSMQTGVAVHAVQ